jgi:uncharacterized protein
VILRDLLTVVSGLFVGVASGIMGIGGGILLVPLMTLGFGLTQQVAQGTSLAAVIPTAAVGAVTHDRRGKVLRRPALYMGAGSAVGAVIGALVAIHLPREVLTRAFGLILLFAAYRLWPRKAETVPQ